MVDSPTDLFLLFEFMGKDVLNIFGQLVFTRVFGG